MARMPIHVITTRAALVGAATYGLASLNDIKGAYEEYLPPANLAGIGNHNSKQSEGVYAWRQILSP